MSQTVKIKSVSLTVATKLLFVFTCSLAHAQQAKLTDEQALRTAKRAFDAEGWNPAIFEVKPIGDGHRDAFLDAMSAGDFLGVHMERLMREFGNGPYTVVSYRRRASTLISNGGAEYGAIFFLVYSQKKVAILDSRVSPRPKDKKPLEGAAAEQGGAGQPAAGVEPRSEDNEKRETEAEARSQ